MSEQKQLKHLGLIMDGNRRWAKKNGKTIAEGHRQGYAALRELLRATRDLGIPYVSVYAFSTENWKRSRVEVSGIMKLLHWVAKNEIKNTIEEGEKISFIGSRENLPADLKKMIIDVEEKTKNLDRGNLGVCLNYGGQQEIVDAANILASKNEKITVESLSENMYKSEFPPLDLVVRTSGEKRLSNFMLWRSSYAELEFTDTLWPDFDSEELRKIVADFNDRTRRFGG